MGGNGLFCFTSLLWTVTGRGDQTHADIEVRYGGERQTCDGLRWLGIYRAAAKTIDEMSRIIFNDYVNATLTALLIGLVVAMVAFAVAAIPKALADPNVTARETAVVPAE
jgi:hypothetical protein